MLLLVLYSMTFIGSIEPISPAQSYTAADRESADNGGRSATHNIHRDEMGTTTGRDADTNTKVVLKSKRNVEFEIYDTNEERHSLQAQQQRFRALEGTAREERRRVECRRVVCAAERAERRHPRAPRAAARFRAVRR